MDYYRIARKAAEAESVTGVCLADRDDLVQEAAIAAWCCSCEKNSHVIQKARWRIREVLRARDQRIRCLNGQYARKEGERTRFGPLEVRETDETGEGRIVAGDLLNRAAEILSPQGRAYLAHLVREGRDPEGTDAVKRCRRRAEIRWAIERAERSRRRTKIRRAIGRVELGESEL